MDVLTIDIGGTNIKILATGEREPRKFPWGPKLAPRCRTGNNAYAFVGGFRMWKTGPTKSTHGQPPSSRK